MMENFINNLFFSEEKYRHLINFVVISFFLTLALIFTIEILNSVKGSRYLYRHHYEHWKLTKGTIAQRKQAMRNPVVDPVYSKILSRTNKLWNILLAIWLTVSVIVALAVVVIDIFDLQI